MSATITQPFCLGLTQLEQSPKYPMIRSWTGAELMRSDLQSAERVRRANNPCCMAANVLTTLLSPVASIILEHLLRVQKNRAFYGA
jgi:hypothetical protein